MSARQAPDTNDDNISPPVHRENSNINNNNNHRQNDNNNSTSALPHRRLAQVSATQLLDYFRTQMSNQQQQQQPKNEDENNNSKSRTKPPERITLKGICEDAQDLTPRTRRACLNCGIDFHVEVIAMPSLKNLPAAARGHAEAEAKWLRHLGARRFDVLEALDMERTRMIESQHEAFLEQQHQQRQSVSQKNAANRGGAPAKSPTPNSRKLHDEDDDAYDNESNHVGSARNHNNNNKNNNNNASNSSALSSPRSGTGVSRKQSAMLMDPAELQAHRAAKREAAMVEAMQRRLAAQQRARQTEERAMALAQLALKKQVEQERAAKLAKEKADKINAQKKAQRAEQEHQKMLHRREVQQMRDELEKALLEQQLQKEAEKDLTVEERRKVRSDRLRAQRRELEAQRVEQMERLRFLQRSIEDAEERKKLDYEERMQQADIARERQKSKKEEVLAMHSAFQEERTHLYSERKEKLEEAHAASITRYKEKGDAAIEKRDEILSERNKILKQRILQHAQREIQAKQLRHELERQEEEVAKELEVRLVVQEKRSKKVLQEKQDFSKIRLAEKQMVLHDHKMHANHIHKMHEVREQAQAKKLEQKLRRIEQLKEDAEELEQYRKGLRHILDQGGDFLLMDANSSEVRHRSPAHHQAGAANHDVRRDQNRETSYVNRRALTPMPSSNAAMNGNYSSRANNNHNNSGLARMEPVSNHPGGFSGSNNQGGYYSRNTAPAPLTPEPR